MPFKRLGPKNPHQEFSAQWTNSNIKLKIEAARSFPETLGKIYKYCPPDGKLLEAGCGLGGWILHLKSKGYDVYGIDFVESAIDAIKAYDASMKVSVGDATKIDFPDSSFDFYLSLGVIEHLEDGPEPYLEEAYRLIKPGGYGLISVPNRDYQLFKDTANGPDDKVFFQYEYGAEEYEEVLKASGFKIIEHYYTSFSNYLWRKRIFRALNRHPYRINLLGKIIAGTLAKANFKKYALMRECIVSPVK